MDAVRQARKKCGPLRKNDSKAYDKCVRDTTFSLRTGGAKKGGVIKRKHSRGKRGRSKRRK